MIKLRLAGAGVALALLGAACQAATDLPAEQVADLPQIQEVQGEAQEPQSGLQEPTAVPTVQEQVPTPNESTPVPVRTDLAATNPATVNLANGTPTLVEFFAFW